MLVTFLPRSVKDDDRPVIVSDESLKDMELTEEDVLDRAIELAEAHEAIDRWATAYGRIPTE